MSTAEARKAPSTKTKTRTVPLAKGRANGTPAKGRANGTVLGRLAPGTRNWQPQERARFVVDVVGGTRRTADLLDVAPSQPSRWVSGASVPGPAQARMLVDLEHVLTHALLVWADAEVARDWLTTPNGHLDGARPVEWIRVHGTAEVVDALRAEAAGTFA